MQNLWVWPMLLEPIFLPEDGNRSNFRNVAYINILYLLRNSSVRIVITKGSNNDKL